MNPTFLCLFSFCRVVGQMFMILVLWFGSWIIFKLFSCPFFYSFSNHVISLEPDKGPPEFRNCQLPKKHWEVLKKQNRAGCRFDSWSGRVPEGSQPMYSLLYQRFSLPLSLPLPLSLKAKKKCPQTRRETERERDRTHSILQTSFWIRTPSPLSLK